MDVGMFRIDGRHLIYERTAKPSEPRLARFSYSLLKITVEADGSISDVEVSRSSGFELLDGAAVVAVRGWKGVPATQNGRPVATVEYLPIRFRLPGR